MFRLSDLYDSTEFVAPVRCDEKYVSPKLHIVLFTLPINLLGEMFMASDWSNIAAF